MPSVPSLPATVTAGNKIKAADWNLMVNYLTFQRNPPRFVGSIKTATAITGSAAIKYPSIIDTASGWNVGTGQYTFQYPGTYRLSSQMKWGAVTPGTVGLQMILNGSQTLISVSAPNANFSGPQLHGELHGIAAGDVLSAQVTVGFTTQSDTPADNNYLILTWTGS